MARIALLILDVDGVLTDGRFFRLPSGDEIKSFHTQDGHGMAKLQKSGIPIAIISGRDSISVDQRMQELGIQHVHQGIKDKLAVFEKLIDTLNITADQVAYVGDDEPDITVMSRVGYKIAVANATPAVLEIADWVTQNEGGAGAVREVCEWILANDDA